jgi:hypothetical protein
MSHKLNDPDEKKEADERKEADEEKQEVVITPAGPMPKDRVHPVGPGQVVRRNEDGTYSVVPKE